VTIRVSKNQLIAGVPSIKGRKVGLSLLGVDEFVRLLKRRPEMPHRVVFGDVEKLTASIQQQIKKWKEGEL
jgi:hypothetical protein